METEKKKVVTEGLKEALEKFEGVLKGSEGNPIMVSGEPGTGRVSSLMPPKVTGNRSRV